LVTPHAEQLVPFEAVFLLVDARKAIPYPPQMGKARFMEQTQKLSIGSFGRLVQANSGILLDRNGPEQQIPAHGGGKLPIRIQADRMISTPDFASAQMFQKWQIKVNDGAWK
jgi:hypothetical protein